MSTRVGPGTGVGASVGERVGATVGRGVGNAVGSGVSVARMGVAGAGGAGPAHADSSNPQTATSATTRLDIAYLSYRKLTHDSARAAHPRVWRRGLTRHGLRGARAGRSYRGGAESDDRSAHNRTADDSPHAGADTAAHAHPDSRAYPLADRGAH